MQRRRFSSKAHRRLRLMLLASASLIGYGDRVYGDSPVVEVASAPIPAERAGNDVELLAPANSTLEIRIARRPWLFDRLTKPSPPPSVKMDPPKPPQEVLPAEPPSVKQIVPEVDADAWTLRQSDADASAARGTKTAPNELSGRTPGGTSFADITAAAPDSDQAATRSSQSRDDAFVQREFELAPLSADEPPANNEESVADSSNGNATAANVLDDEEPQPLVDPIDEVKEIGSNRSAEIELGVQQLEPELQGIDVAGEMPSDAGVDESAAPAELDESNLADPAGPTDEEEAGEEVTVRKLRINRDGTPVGESDVEFDNEPQDDEISLAEPGASVSDLSEEVIAQDAPSQNESAPAEIADVPGTLGVDLDYTGYPRVPIRLASSLQRMQGTMQQCLRYYYARPENANERSNWGMLHSIMVFGADTKIIAGNKNYSAIAWIAGNNACRGQKLIEERDGRIAATSGVGLQGHQAQMLAIFALCDVPAEYPLYAGSRRFSVQDLVKEEMLACRTGEELTFTLIALSHYLDTDSVWKNASGETWNFERLIREELGQPIVGAACGGTHRLMGFAHALRNRRAEGLPITGQWKRAEVYGQDFVKYAYRLQNRDGSMSTDWFEGREDNGDVDRKIQTTGHMVEWLLTVTPDSELQDQRLVSAVRFLLSSIYNDRSHDWKVGPKGHALRSLAMYYERVYQQGPAWRTTGVATGQSNQRR